MTTKEFLAFYPQFGPIPKAVLEDSVQRANTRFDFLEEDAECARRLYMAHLLTLYAATMPTGEMTMESLSASGENRTTASKKVGELSVTYARGSDEGAAFTDLGRTVYGVQLRQLLRLHLSALYVP